MHARVVTMQIDPDRINETVRIFRDSVVPAAKEQVGFKGGLFLVDAAAGKALSITMWEREVDLRATEMHYLAEQVAKFKNVLAAPMVRESYEVHVLFL